MRDDVIRYDVIIVGGGLVGAGFAAALHSSGLSIALIDARHPANDDPRLFALNSSSCHFLKNLGLWEALALYASPIHQVHVSYQGHFGAVRLNREEVALPELGHVVPAYQIEMALNKKLVSLAHVVSYRPAVLQTLQQENGVAYVTIKTENGEVTMAASLVIGADGSASTVRQQLGMATEVFDYKQCAIVTKTTLHRSHQQIAYERFYSQGAIAMLPLMGDECATIWTADHACVAKLQALSDDDFLQALQKEFGYRLGRLQKTHQRHVFPLQKICAKKTWEQCVFLLGNAAHTLSPIAAQGLNLALYEVAVLVENLLRKPFIQALTSQDLQQIHAQMEKHQSMSIAASHWLSQFFSKKWPFFSTLLPFGMTGFDIMMPMKRRFIKAMLGWSGEVPRLLLSESS